MKFLTFNNEHAVRMLNVLYRKKDGSFTPVRELIEKTGYDQTNANDLMRTLRQDEIVEEKWIEEKLPIGRDASKDHLTYRLTEKGQKIVNNLRKIRRIAEADDIL